MNKTIEHTGWQLQQQQAFYKLSQFYINPFVPKPTLSLPPENIGKI